jgi:cell division protein FtsL
VFVLLAGIVFLNVTLLRINREIAASAAKSRAVKLENAQLRTNIARLGSSERIQRVAAQRGLVLPAPGEVRYLKSSPRPDARNAAARLKNGGSMSQPAVAPQAGLQTQTAPPAQATPQAQPQAPTQAQPNAQPPASTQAPVAAQPQAQPSG